MYFELKQKSFTWFISTTILNILYNHVSTIFHYIIHTMIGNQNSDLLIENENVDYYDKSY